MLPQRAGVRLAGLGEVAEIALHHPLGTAWPPPDTHIDFTGPPGTNPLASGGALLYDVVSDAGALPAAGFWWTTLSQLLLEVPDWQRDFGPDLLAAALLANPGWLGPVTSVPVYFESGEGLHMRWIRSTFRGTLGGVEEFQHKVDWGNPGADPTINEATALAFAEQLAGLWNASWTPAGPTTMSGAFTSDVIYTEVGVVSINATSATDKTGKGGNAAEDFTTQWHMYPSGLRPVGAGAPYSLPYEVACALTLQTDYRGPSGRGRLYLPPFTMGAMADGGVYGGLHVTAATAFGRFLTAVKAASPYVPVVVSNRRLQLHEVKEVLVGKVPDSQRRRRRSQDEARVTVWG